jgi:hypothetical protein
MDRHGELGRRTHKIAIVEPMGEKVTHFQRERQTWQNNRAKIDKETEGIVWLIARFLHWLMWLTPTQWGFTLLPREADTKTLEARLNRFTEWYVPGVLIASALIYYLAPRVSFAWFTYLLAWLSTYISASTLVVMLHIVLLQPTFGPIKSAERSLLLFICNAAQIVVMFATWYRLCGQPAPLLKSILTFATIEYANKMPRLAIVQIATDFLLLAIFLGFLLGRFGAKNGSK